jgi:hypothetical protein
VPDGVVFKVRYHAQLYLWYETRCFSTFKISTSSNVEEVSWLSYLVPIFEKSFFFKVLREDLKIF